MMRAVLGAVAASALLLYLVLRNQIKRKRDEAFAVAKGCGPPRKLPARWPFGLDLLLQVSVHARNQTILQFFLEIIEVSGSTHEQNLLGARGINTVDPHNLEAILSKQFDDFDLGLRPVHFAPLMGSGIFTQDGAQWKRSRDLLRPQFVSNRSQNFETVKDCVENLLAQITPDQVIDLQPLFFRLTFDTTTFLLFGETMSSLQPTTIANQESEFASAFTLGQEYISHRGRLGKFYWLMNPPAFRRACKTTHEFVEAVVQKALDSTEDKKAQNSLADKPRYFIDSLVQQTRDKAVLRDNCLNVLLAGRDTTACCLTWTMRLLARHPKVLSKLRTEIESVTSLGESATEPTRDDLKRMPYLALVIKEVLRLYPSVPVNSRAARKTTTIPVGGGPNGDQAVLIRKGEAVGYCVYAMHRRKDIYGPDAHAFRPERWEEDALKDVGYGYLPFNGGPRICLGQDFAILEAGYTVVRILQRFPFVALPEGEFTGEIGKEKQTLTLVVSSGEGCRVVLSQQEE